MPGQAGSGSFLVDQHGVDACKPLGGGIVVVEHHQVLDFVTEFLVDVFQEGEINHGHSGVRR